MKNRRGIIFVSDSIFDENYDAMFLLFSKFVPLYIEHVFYGRNYIGVCSEFKEIKEGEVMPTYEAIITKNEKGTNINFNILK